MKRPAKKKAPPKYPALVLDTETTGLIDNRSVGLNRLPEVIEFYGALADLASGEVLSELHHLIKPSRPLSDVPEGKGKKTITQITGISNDMLKDAKPFEAVAGLIFDYVERAPLVIAQNASFDKEMLDIEAERIGRTIKWPPVLCLIEQTIHLKGFRLKLSDLHQLLVGEPFTGAHRAKADTMALLRCCVVLHKRGDL